MKLRCQCCDVEFEAVCPRCNEAHRVEPAEPVRLGEEGRRIIHQLFSEETEEES
jgi:hypothetical protein